MFTKMYIQKIENMIKSYMSLFHFYLNLAFKKNIEFSLLSCEHLILCALLSSLLRKENTVFLSMMPFTYCYYLTLLYGS